MKLDAKRRFITASSSDPGTPCVSEAGTDRVLFFFNLSGAYGGYAGSDKAMEDCERIVRRHNDYPEVIEVLEELLLCENAPGLLQVRRRQALEKALGLIARKK